MKETFAVFSSPRSRLSSLTKRLETEEKETFLVALSAWLGVG